MAELFANSGDPDQMPHSAVSYLGLYCLPITLLGVSRLKWVKGEWIHLGPVEKLTESLVNVLLKILFIKYGIYANIFAKKM